MYRSRENDSLREIVIWTICLKNKDLPGPGKHKKHETYVTISNDAKKAKRWYEIHSQARTTHTHFGTHTITQANPRDDNVMEIRALRRSKMTHKSCARESVQNTAVCMMGTNSRLMSGELSHKYLSVCCMEHFPGKLQ